MSFNALNIKFLFTDAEKPIEKHFYSSELELDLCLSIGEYTKFEESEESLFYISITDEDDLCYQYSAFSYDMVLAAFNDLKDLVTEDDFYSKIYPDTCLSYGFIKELN